MSVELHQPGADLLASTMVESFDYTIKRQRRKTIALHVLADASVEVRAPKWVSKRELISFVEQRSDWVVEQRRVALKRQAKKPAFRHGHYHPFMGESYPLCVELSGRAAVQLQGGALMVKVRDPQQPQMVQKALEQWYRLQAKVVFEERMFACFEKFPLWFQAQYRVPTITVRKMRRRWGSCSSKGEVTLNVFLMKFPLQCIDYVIVHELCHLEEFHHGKAFYQLLASVMPSWRESEALIEQLSRTD